jgi:hypothetical protein
LLMLPTDTPVLAKTSDFIITTRLAVQTPLTNHGAYLTPAHPLNTDSLEVARHRRKAAEVTQEETSTRAFSVQPVVSNERSGWA